MESSSSSFFLYLSALLGFIVAGVILRSLRRKGNLPPGPKQWPIIGNLHLLSSLPHRDVHALALKYGPLMHLRLGSRPVIVASTAEAAKLILKTHDISFASRPQIAAGKHTAYNFSDITWSPYGPYWRQARKICAVELFTPKRLDSSGYIRVEEVSSLVRAIKAQTGRRIALADHLSALSLNIASRTVLGKSYTADESSAFSNADLKNLTDELSLLNGVHNIGDLIPWLDFLDLQGYIKRMKAVAARLDQFFEHVLDEHAERRRREGAGHVNRDMVDVLLELSEDPSLEVKIGRTGVKAFAQNMLAGGTDSSTATVEWVMSELMKHPEALVAVAEELDAVVGRERWVGEEDIPRLPYLGAVVKETMRLHPLTPMLAPRVAREDVVVGGYDVPAGTQALVSVWTIGRDPALWEAPEEFRPERFVGSAVDVKGQHYELLPFGSGRRMCPGYPLALKVVNLALANLVHGFEWRLPDGMSRDELSLEESFRLLTIKKDPLKVVAHPRLAAHLYL